jgi:hypothetical protein
MPGPHGDIRGLLERLVALQQSPQVSRQLFNGRTLRLQDLLSTASFQ